MLLTNEVTNWSAHNLSLEICKKFYGDNLLVVNDTWMPWEKSFPIMETWLNLNKDHKVIYISMYDPAQKIMFSGPHKDRVEYIETKDICFWLIAVDKFFLDYSIDDVTPKSFDYKFVCYQRKPNPFREFIYNQLKDKNGIVTIGSKKFDNINVDVPSHHGLSEVGGVEGVPHDLYSLGNINLWNRSFINIVSETIQFFNSEHPFISEKSFKPIIGLRPFICFGHPRTSEFLKSRGFETFDDEFGYHPTEDWKDNALQIINIIDNLDVSMYETFMPKLLHNKNWIKNAATLEWEKLDELVKQYC